MAGCPRHSIATVMERDPLLLSSESAITYLADIQMSLGIQVSIIFYQWTSRSERYNCSTRRALGGGLLTCDMKEDSTTLG